MVLTAFDTAWALLKDFTFNPEEGKENALGYAPTRSMVIPRRWVYHDEMESFDPDRIQDTAENEAFWDNAAGNVPVVNLAHEHWRDFDPDNELNMADLIHVLEHEHLHDSPTFGAGVALDSTDLLQHWARELGKNAWFGPGAEDWYGVKETDEELDEQHRDWVLEREHEAMWQLQGDIPSLREREDNDGI